MIRKITLLSLLFVTALISGGHDEGQAKSLNEGSGAAIELGRRIYQQGKGSDGSPIAATVLGNVKVFGDQFTCLNCHRRSGLGGPEGTKFVLPTNGRSLLFPREDMYMARPGYTLQTFSNAILRGVNPAGLPFDPIMPQYDLSSEEVKALFLYLETLSNDYSPGLTDEFLHVATVVGKDVPLSERQAMLKVIDAFFKNKNAQTRKEVKRSKSGPYYHEYRNKAYRTWTHHLWELSGPPDTWRAQLQEYYRKQPVFALLSGMVTGSWQPVHEFSREYGIPCLLPNTDMPVEDQGNYYTLYYSRGLALEAGVLLSELLKSDSDETLVQVYRAGTKGEQAAEALLLQSEGSGLSLRSVAIEKDGNFSPLDRVLAGGAGTAVLWLNGADLLTLQRQVGKKLLKRSVYLSSSLLDGNLEIIPDSIGNRNYAIHPFVLPEDQKGRFFLVDAWLRGNKLELSNRRIQGQTHYACLILNAGLKHIKRYFYRDYLLDLIDHGDRMARYSGVYPRLSFGPEQRFLAKGAYLIDLDSDLSSWIVPYSGGNNRQR